MAACRKVRYRTHHAAMLALVSCRIERALHGADKRAEMRAYRCPRCGGAWHLTSQPLRPE